MFKGFNGLTLLLAVIGVFFAAGTAHAFGPATHLELSGQILANLSLIPAATAQLISAYPFDFYYGSIAADIVVAKKMAPYLHHCHRWTVGLDVLENSEKPSQKAFALGYMTHLAADVVAHNYFVPYKLIVGFTSKANNHALLEMRFDSYAPQKVWEIPPLISREMHLDNDELLKRVLSRQLFSFATNKTLFKGVVLLSRSSKWQSLVQKAMENQSPALDLERIDHYKALSFNACTSLLSEMEESWIFCADPTGQNSLKAAGEVARRLRNDFLKGKLSREGFTRILERYRPHLEASLFAKPNADRLFLSAMEIIESEKH
ncbi:hypothetical protein EPN96_03195 [bacterium]|nr:MAG: hypothetical protein EPN96_03195 [bacterium]